MGGMLLSESCRIEERTAGTAALVPEVQWESWRRAFFAGCGTYARFLNLPTERLRRKDTCAILGAFNCITAQRL